MDARSRCNIALAAGVSASGVRRCRFDEHALLAHDPAHKHSFKSRPSRRIFMKRNLIAAVAMTAALTLPAQANNIVDEWASTKAPAAPTLKPVTVDPEDDGPPDARFHESELRQAPALPRHDSGNEKAARCRARGQGDRGVQPDRQHHGGRCDQGCGAGDRRGIGSLRPGQVSERRTSRRSSRTRALRQSLPLALRPMAPFSTPGAALRSAA